MALVRQALRWRCALLALALLVLLAPLRCRATGEDDVAPTTANWVNLNLVAVDARGWYPPLGTVPVFYQDATASPPVTLNTDTLIAPYCHSYYVTNSSNPMLYQILCRTTLPTGEPGDLPLYPEDILGASFGAAPFTYALIECYALDTERWFLADPSLLNTPPLPPPAGAPSPYAPSCFNATYGYYSQGLPMSIYSPPAARAAPPNPTTQYYCTTVHTYDTGMLLSDGVPVVHINETVCTFVGFNAATVSASADCSALNYLTAVCNTTLTSTTAAALIVDVQPWTCAFACAVPCVTSVAAVSFADCADTAVLSSNGLYVAGGQSNCLPSAQEYQCGSNIHALSPPFCDNEGEQALALLDVYLPVNQSNLAQVLTECAPGALGCYVECTCFNSGCPDHPNCSRHGTWTQSPSDLIAPACSCDAGYEGPMCELQISNIPCNYGQESTVQLIS